jgi:hypothetical protein
MLSSQVRASSIFTPSTARTLSEAVRAKGQKAPDGAEPQSSKGLNLATPQQQH